MPYRRIPLVTGEIYHIYNRSIEGRPIFSSKFDYRRAVQTLDYYRYGCQPQSLARYLQGDALQQHVHQSSWSAETQNVDILAYCLMPNHYHLLLRQEKDEGISNFLSQLQNSYTRYFNTKNKRTGPLFSGPFKAVRVESQSQLLHVSRYIHLNPFSGHIVRNSEDTLDFPWSSCSEYLGYPGWAIVNPSLVLQSFESHHHYRDFLLNQADYQRKSSDLRHLMVEDFRLV